MKIAVSTSYLLISLLPISKVLSFPGKDKIRKYIVSGAPAVVKLLSNTFYPLWLSGLYIMKNCTECKLCTFSCLQKECSHPRGPKKTPQQLKKPRLEDTGSTCNLRVYEKDEKSRIQRKIQKDCSQTCPWNI